MSINIKGSASKANRTTANKTSNTGKSSKGGASAASTHKPDNDSIDLTDTASKLQQIEQSLGDIPIVDSGRVEALTQSISDGKYQINNEKIADRIISSEHEINQRKKQ
ncbi:MAG: flagellar biosynthesis anti-sigma factor FlgM [Cycloclasticus sp. symbiont of Bathymodiolus heckerae]|nr:MAG: flagellar biosynthesis anti-sigma factor FlgM [Cycloclasticus sp. symbiont of Bathymodiolus heckerae]